MPATHYLLTNNTTQFTIEAPGAGVIYLGEVGRPADFIATLNGQPVPIFVANHAFKAVAVAQKGTYHVVVRYWPQHLTMYIVMAFLGLAGWAGFLWVFYRRYVRVNEGSGSHLPTDSHDRRTIRRCLS